MQPVLTVAEMQAVDAAAQATVPLEVLVARAGTAVATAALAMLGGAYGRRVVVVAGKGNNGADGRVAAGRLSGRGARIEVVAPGDRTRLPAVDLVIDAAFGTGFRGGYDAPSCPPGTPVLAVDIPSGVLGDTGEAPGSPLPADRTVTFVAAKPGLVQGAGRSLAGRVVVADIGLPAGPARIHVLEDSDIADLVPERNEAGNKWDAAVLVVAGSPGMTGAAGMCARAALRTGSGMVRLGVPGGDLAGSPAPEAVGLPLAANGWSGDALTAADRCGAVVVGPGLGRDPATAADVRRLVALSPVPVVVDADGLFALGSFAAGRPLETRSPVVLTPHDGEYGRLLSPPGPDRIDAARRLAAASGTIALVKGPTTTVAEPSGRVLVAMAGSPRLATAGTGDVLSGMIGALIARGVDPHRAAAAAAHLHGRAAGLGPAEGLVAGDLPGLVSSVFSALRDGHRRG